MSQFADRGAVTACGRIRNIPLLELLAENMEANRCIDELLKQLEEEHRNVRREKLAVARLQREVARSKSEGTMREKLILQLEEERRLRLESEKRLREVTEEAELGRAQMVSLQQQFSRMEETVRSLLRNQTVDTVDIMKVYKDKLSEEETKQPNGAGENGPPPAPQPDPDLEASRVEEDGDKTKDLLERLKALEERNCALALENENQREQYEHCLDEVANQVVQALLTQKDLREECLKLRTRVFDLEQQNRALSILFQQKIKPASDLLLQKLHSRILDLSAADLLLEPERNKAFLLSRHSDGPANEPARKSAERKCLSQLSLAPPPAYPRSSCSSSELSLSSACSDFSSGSYTWNDGRSSGKQSSLTWEKRLSLGSSAPGNICAPPEEQQPTRRKESHILEGLRKLQRRRHCSSSASSKASKSGYKDCMNSNEGIYSLGIKSGAKVSKPSPGGGCKKFSYDSDDADDELVHSSHGDNIPTRDNWLYCQRLSHSVSDSLCSWEGTQDSSVRPPPGYGSKDGPEELLSFINSFLPEGGRTSAFTKPSKLHSNPPDPEEPQQGPHLGPESPDVQSERAERDPKRLSRDATKLLTQQWLQREQGRTQSADRRPRPFCLIKEPLGARCTQSEESILAIFDAEGEPIELAQKDAGGVPGSSAEYSELVPQERPTRQKAASSRDYSVLESTSEHQVRTSRSREVGSDRLSIQLTPRRKLIKPPSSRTNRGHSIPPMNDSAAARSAGSKIPGGTKPSGSPLRLSKGSITEPGTGGPPQEKSSCSPTVKTSRFNKMASSCSQSPKAASTRLPGRAEWKSPAPGSHRQPVYADHGEQPTRDKHCEPSKNKLRSPSPPPPPGRTTSLLVRPNYEGSPQAHKSWVAQPSTPTTVRGPPPSYHTSLLPNMQSTLPIKDKDCSELDAGYGTALAPQRLVDRTSQHLHKSHATAQLSAKGTARRSAKTDYLPSANSGCAPETDYAPKGSKNVPPPYSALRGSSVQSSFVSKRGPAHENVHPVVQKPSVSLPASLQDATQSKTEPIVVSPPSSITLSPNTPEKASKSRIPMGFKAFLKSPPANKNSPSVAGKQEKDHINSVSKETVALHASSQCENLQPASVGSPARSSVADGTAELQVRGQEEEAAAEVSLEDGDPKGKRSSQLFSRSISVTTKAHLKPALGMNGAKARSQSFGANYMEKPSVQIPEGPGKIRTQIITNSGERGNSLTRQGSLEVPAESPIHSPRTRLSHYGGMTASPGHGLLLEGTKSGSRGEGPPTVTSPSQKEARNLAGNERPAVNIRKAAKVSSHPFQTPPSSSHTCQKPAAANHEADFCPETKTQTDSPDHSPEISPSVCTIEEKVMMGIEENVQKCQEQEKVASSETKHRTGPSLANWFGLRRSKLPALSGKKAESPKGKDEKKELKIGSVLGGKSDKKKEKKKSENQEGQSLLEVNNKLSSIMDHCNNHMGQIASHIQSSTGFMGKEQLVRELLGRAAVKGSCVSPPAIPAARKHSEMKEICCDTATLLMSQKIQLRDSEEVPDSSCQDHMMGSGCQTRTLDSGIGTFPLPDSVTRTGTRHIPKSESSPDRVTADSASSHPDPSQSDVKVPSLPQSRLHDPPSMGHSQSESSVTSGRQDQDVQKYPPTCSDAIRTKRWSLVSPRSAEDKHKEMEKKKKMKEFESPPERALQLCTYSGSSSDMETEGETLMSPRRKLMSRSTRSRSAEEGQDTLKRRSQDETPTIMELYQQDVLFRLEDGRRITQCTLLQRETLLGGDAADRLSKEIVMEAPPIGGNDFSLNKLNHGAPCGGSLFPVPGFAVMGGDEPLPSSSRPGLDPVGSLSDSLYESFSSCTSQGSNDV